MTRDATSEPGSGRAAPADIRERIRAEIERLTPRLLEVSHEIHDHPELGFEEHRAHDLLTRVLADEGLDVTPRAHGLDTAFAARAGEEGPIVAVCCEYDALPGIGHACGHNIIAAAGLGAGLAAARVARELGGRVLILGTPAEEGGGGKELMARDGAFDGVAAAVMVHPANHELERIHAIAIHTCDVTYRGRAAHAAAAPEQGRNALDGAVLGYMNVAALRQHIRPDERIHGVFTDGGGKPNIVPEHAAAQWYVRSPTLASLEPLKERVVACLEAGAMAAGVEVDIAWNDPPFADMVDNPVLLELYRRNAEALGRHPRPEGEAMVVGSTDMGNVSHRVPAIHPMIKVAPDEVPIHTPEFAHWAASPDGDRAVVDGALALAWTLADCLADPRLLDEAGAAFAASR
ncbi:MAG: M20 family peptidase [Actinomyces sp.]|nr:MAG: M20 family peptidase [Actinomyces sp.]